MLLFIRKVRNALLIFLSVNIGLISGQKCYLRNHYYIVRLTAECSDSAEIENFIETNLLCYMEEAVQNKSKPELMAKNTREIEDSLYSLFQMNSSVSFGLAEWQNVHGANRKVPTGIFDSIQIKIGNTDAAEQEFVVCRAEDAIFWTDDILPIHYFILEWIGKAEIFLLQGKNNCKNG